MQYYDHHGGSQVDEVREFKSPFELGEYLRAKLWPFYVDVTFNNLKAEQCGHARRHGWKEVWIVSIDGYGVCGWADGWFPRPENGQGL